MHLKVDFENSCHHKGLFWTMNIQYFANTIQEPDVIAWFVHIYKIKAILQTYFWKLIFAQM